MINEILADLNQFLAQDHDADSEKQWAITQTKNSTVKQLLMHISTRDIQIIATIDAHAPLSQKQLPTMVNTSQATASRAVARLTKDNLIIRERMPDNAKEWQLRLSTNGREVARIKGLLDMRLHTAAMNIASHYSEEELARFRQLLDEIIHISAHAFPAPHEH